MRLNELKPKHKAKKGKRVGRGGKRGTYSGKGMKGQKSRAGKRMQPVIRELIKRYPKKRGYKFGSLFRNRPLKPIILNLDFLEKKFKAEEVITPALLIEKKIIRKIKGRVPKVKILGRGKLTKKIDLEGFSVSKSAKAMIERAGGKINPAKEKTKNNKLKTNLNTKEQKPKTKTLVQKPKGEK